MLQGFGKSCVLHGVFHFGAMFFCGIYTHDEGVCVDLVYWDFDKVTSISSVCLGDSVGLPVEVAMLSMSMENYVCACLICRSFFVFPAMLPWLVATVLSRKGEMRKNFLTCFGWRRKTFILSPSRRRLGVAFCRDVLYGVQGVSFSS